MSKMTKAQKADRDEAIVQLREICPPGTEVRCILRHCSRSEMQREISALVGDYRDISYLVARAIGSRLGKHHAVIMGGCGMDMGFAMVNALSYALHGTDVPRAGYTLTHQWI